MPLLLVGRALLGDASVSEDNIVHFNPWRDFNDAADSHHQQDADHQEQRVTFKSAVIEHEFSPYALMTA